MDVIWFVVLEIEGNRKPIRVLGMISCRKKMKETNICCQCEKKEICSIRRQSNNCLSCEEEGSWVSKRTGVKMKHIRESMQKLLTEMSLIYFFFNCPHSSILPPIVTKLKRKVFCQKKKKKNPPQCKFFLKRIFFFSNA